MRITKGPASERELTDALEKALLPYAGVYPVVNGRNFVLRCDNGRNQYARRSTSGRRTNAANWQVHYFTLLHLFNTWPNATIRTAIITYKGRDNFLATAADTAHHNVGSIRNPVAIGSL